MKKHEIILNIADLPIDIDGYKLHIYESRVLESWGLICERGKLNITRLLNIFDDDDGIKCYPFNRNLEYQFAMVYEKNERSLFGEISYGPLRECLRTMWMKVSEYKNKKFKEGT